MSRRRLYRSAWWVWLLVVHIILVTQVLGSATARRICEYAGYCDRDELSDYYRSKRLFLRRQTTLVNDNHALVIGDSHVEGLAFGLIDPLSLNAGIGGDTSFGVLQRLSDYQPYDRWRYVVLSVGFNDLQFRQPAEIADNYKSMIERLGPATKVFVLAITPLDEIVAARHHAGKNERIVKTNNLVRDTAARFSNVVFLDPGASISDEQGSLRRDMHLGDGIHLNRLGQLAVICQLRAEMSSHTRQIGDTDGRCQKRVG